MTKSYDGPPPTVFQLNPSTLAAIDTRCKQTGQSRNDYLAMLVFEDQKKWRKSAAVIEVEVEQAEREMVGI